MSNRTKTSVSCGIAMAVGGVTHSMLELAPLPKSVAVGLAAGFAFLVMNAVLPSNEAA